MMNLKASSCPTLILLGCLMALPAHAFWSSVPIDRTNIGSYGSFLRIKAKSFGLTNDQRVFFTIVVMPATNHVSLDFWSGYLTVFDVSSGSTNRPIVTTAVRPRNGFFGKEVPERLRAKCKTFEFSIDSAFVGASEFSLNEPVDTKWGTAGTGYIIKLRDFADTK